MDERIESLFNESILMERKVAVLYRLFANIFPDDAGFWESIAFEEENHALLLHSGKDYFFEAGHFPMEALDQDLAEIKKANSEIDGKLSLYQINPPSRKEAFDYAVVIEDSAGDICFQRVIELQKKSLAIDLFKSLVDDGCNHKKRIIEQFNKHAEPC